MHAQDTNTPNDDSLTGVAIPRATGTDGPTVASRPLRIALISGEASGDLLGASLVQGLRRQAGSRFAFEFVGVGSTAMRQQGVDLWWDCQELAVMGLAEVLRHLPRLLRLRRALLSRLLSFRPDLVVGIDAPDFNLGLERKLRARGIRTAHYVSPSLWAWRQGRAAKIGQSADRVLCLFPNEPDIYAQFKVDARFVGHPTASIMALDPDTEAARRGLGLPASGRLLALLPGSRGSELQRLAEPFLHAAALFRRAHSDFEFLIPHASTHTAEALQLAWYQAIARAPESASPQAPSAKELHELRTVTHEFSGQSHAVLVAADMVLLASGTATLEAMLAKKPMVVGYRIAPLTHFIVKGLGLLKVDRYSLPNMLAGNHLVDECMQQDCRAEVLSARLSSLWSDEARRAALQPAYRELHQRLLPPVEDAAARALLDLVCGTWNEGHGPVSPAHA